MSPPTNNISERPKSPVEFGDLEKRGSFVNMDELIHHEEENVLDLLTIALKIAPSMLGNDGVRKKKGGKIMQKKQCIFISHVVTFCYRS